MLNTTRALILCVFSFYPFLSSAQTSIHAMVADSATLKPISSVTVRVNNSFRGTITNEQGYFLMDVKEEDSLVLSNVGYYSKKVSVREVRKASVIYLAQSVQMLKPIEFSGVVDISSMLPKWDEPSKYRNATVDQRAPAVTGFQGFQTFGPGYVSGFGKLKPNKEEKKLEQIKKENLKAKGYVALVNDPEVKDKLMKEYRLTEQQYYTHLANFNQKNKDFIYDLDDTDVVTLIFQYFSETIKP